MSKADMDFLLYWIPTFAAGFLLMIVGFILQATTPKDKDGNAKKPAS